MKTPWLPLLGSLRVRLELKWEDFWIGAYGKVNKGTLLRQYDLWVCLLPCLPLHFAWEATS